MQLTECGEVDELDNGASLPDFNVCDLALVHSFISYLQLLDFKLGFRIILFVV
jgi:hypothetical protein